MRMSISNMASYTLLGKPRYGLPDGTHLGTNDRTFDQAIKLLDEVTEVVGGTRSKALPVGTLVTTGSRQGKGTIR